MCIPEPYQAYDRYCEDQERELQRCPLCDMCGERITDDHLIDVNGDLFHVECFAEHHMKWTEDYME